MEIVLHIAIRIPDESERKFDLEFLGPEIIIGRDRECDIQIPLSEVSRNHAQIFKLNGHWFVKDLESASGTKLNGQLLPAQGEQVLNQGDVIEISHATISFSLIEHAVVEENSDDQTSIVAQKLVRDILTDPQKAVEQAYLIVIKGPNEGSKLTLSKDLQEFLIGRTESADFYLNDTNISRKHARLRREWNELLIEDLGSKNGVVVNGRKISLPTRLKDSDEIYLGAVRLTYVDPTAKIFDRLEISSATQDELTTDTEVNTEPSIAQLKSLPQSSTHNEKRSAISGFGVAEGLLAALAAMMILGLIYGVGLWLA